VVGFKSDVAKVPNTGTLPLIFHLHHESANESHRPKTLGAFYEHHAGSKTPLEAWFHEAVAAGWQGPQEIKNRYPPADILPGNRVVVNIKGNTYPLIVKIHYNTGIVFIRFVGTHAEYDKIDATTIQVTDHETEDH
jgi:mRNA interferase HigB